MCCARGQQLEDKSRRAAERRNCIVWESAGGIIGHLPGRFCLHLAFCSPFQPFLTLLDGLSHLTCHAAVVMLLFCSVCLGILIKKYCCSVCLGSGPHWSDVAFFSWSVCSASWILSQGWGGVIQAHEYAGDPRGLVNGLSQVVF